MTLTFVLYIIILCSSVLLLFTTYKRTHKPSVSSSHSSSSSSSSSAKPGRTYDVFLSFRGEDTRNNFVGHLYRALDRYGIYTFKDDEQLKRGKVISTALLTAIEESRFSVIVLSENYATSGWCLDELVKIIECMDKFGQIVCPVFYNVDPSHVRKQTKSFKRAFDEHRKTFKKEKDKVLRWREALRRVGSISGSDSRDKDESTLIEDIVRDISDTLFSESSSDDGKLVGMGYHMEQMNSRLCIGSDDVQMVGLWGMGGVGKTTIARALYDRFSRHYDGRCFVANVKEIFRKHDPTIVREKLLSEILLNRNLKAHSLDGGLNVIKERLCRKTVFIVLDDVDDMEQLEALADKHDWFGPGSRIIITTRDKHLLVTHGVNYIHEAGNLKDDEALQLFKQYAFKQEHPTADYLKLSNQYVSYAKGLRLALKVLGSFLHKKSILEWKSELDKLQSIPNVKIQDVLRISFNGLDDKQKDIFLDIACFFKGEDKDFVTNIFESCGFFPHTGVRVLVDKALVTISHNKLWIHDLLQEMGWEVVRQEDVREPGKRSRLWCHKDVCHVFKYNTGTEKVEGIFLDTSKIKELPLNSEVFTRMHNLRLLKIYSSDCNQGLKGSCEVHFPHGLKFLSHELRYLYWHRYPLKCFPTNFHPENLIELNMSYSNLEQLWEGAELMKLKRIELSHSQYLNDLGDLSQAENLESINLEGCMSLREVHSSIQYLNKLIILNLKDCRNLRSSPRTAGLRSLKDLTLSGCSYIKKCPELPENIMHLHLDWTSIGELPRSFGYSRELVTLSLEDCKFLSSLPECFSSLNSLKYLTLSGCSKLTKLPENIGDLSSLVELEAKKIGINQIPSSITGLRGLLSLSLHGCKGEDATGLLLPSLRGLYSLKFLNLSDCNIFELPEDIGSLSSLSFLHLSRNSFESIPESIKQSFLRFLNLRECKRLKSIPKLPTSIQVVDAHNCSSLETVSSLVCNSPADFIFSNCFKLNQNSPRNIMVDVPIKFRIWSQGMIQRPSLRMCYPGSEIPEWFTHQSMGSSVAIQLPAQPFHRFVLCAVVRFEEYCDDSHVTLRCHLLKPPKLNVRIGDPRIYDRWHPWKGRSLLKADHVLIGIENCLLPYIIESYDSCEAAIEFSITAVALGRSQRCKIIKCGVQAF